MTIETINDKKEVSAVGRLVYNRGRYLISTTKDYADDLHRITSKRVLITVRELV